jgi:transposase
MQTNYSWWVGIDWGTQTHQVCAVDGEGKTLREWEVKHDGKAIAAFVEDLLKRAGGRAESIIVAIETPHGSIVEALMERGVAAYFINPKQLDRFRDRHSVGGAKSDQLDAFVLATSLRTDLPLYRRIELGEPALVELRELTRAHEALTADVNALGSRLAAQVHRYYPQVLALGSPYEDLWLWDLLEAAPTPQQGSRLSLAKISSLLRERHIRKVTPQQVYDKLREKPLVVAPGVVTAASQHVALLLPMLRVARRQLVDCDRQIKATLDRVGQPAEVANDAGEPEPGASRPRDAEICLSLPGLGVQTSATILAEASTAVRDRDLPVLRSQAGTAPVSSQTGLQGKSKYHRPQVTMRRACNLRLRNAVHYWARVASQTEAASREHYQRLRKAGHSDGRALRGVGDRLLAMLVAMLKAGSLYDSSRRRVALAA